MTNFSLVALSILNKGPCILGNLESSQSFWVGWLNILRGAWCSPLLLDVLVDQLVDVPVASTRRDLSLGHAFLEELLRVKISEGDAMDIDELSELAFI